jgi:uncharacterized membrane protein YeaQ/YmgE (transglycosylase-associated protein family)
MDALNVVAWLVIGAVAGLIAAVVTKRETAVGYLTDILIGLAGGFIGGLILYAVRISTEGQIAGVNILGAAIALVGAVVFLLILEYVRVTSK